MPERDRNENSEIIISIKLYMLMLDSFAPKVGSGMSVKVTP